MQIHEIDGTRIQEEADLLVTIVDRSITLEMMKQFCRLAEQVHEREKRLFVINLIQGHHTAAPDARRYFSDWSRTNTIDAGATVSSSILVRTTMTLVTSATRLISKRSIPTAFFATEAEARAWIDKQRQQLQAPR